jgi:integrase/recombinase XerD
MAQTLTKKRVTVKAKGTKAGRERLYLVWFQNGKRTWESTNEFIYSNPSGAFERQHNKDVKMKIEMLRNIRETQMFSGEIDDIIEQKLNKNQDFIAYLHKYESEYTKADINTIKSVIIQFKNFAPKIIPAKEVTESLCYKFKEYLQKNYKGETPQSYFARFKKILHQATRDKVFAVSPAIDIKNTKNDSSLNKEVLTVDDLKILANTNCGNNDVKRAFLFACNTGMRFVDIKSLEWAEIKGEKLKFQQNKSMLSSKDGGWVEMKLNENALTILGTPEKGEKMVFPSLPKTSEGINKTLNLWVKRAGLEKHVTFHCARHTFGTLLAYYENDILTISKLLGHTTLKHSVKYIRVSDKMKEKAVNSIPSF